MRPKARGLAQHGGPPVWIEKSVPAVVLRIRRIRMFLGLLDPDPLVKGMDLDPDPSIIKQK
jgi:hypothetical protein